MIGCPLTTFASLSASLILSHGGERKGLVILSGAKNLEAGWMEDEMPPLAETLRFTQGDNTECLFSKE
jgi:hypothetical protein